jgi:hypothetical protein
MQVLVLGMVATVNKLLVAARQIMPLHEEYQCCNPEKTVYPVWFQYGPSSDPQRGATPDDNTLNMYVYS